MSWHKRKTEAKGVVLDIKVPVIKGVPSEKEHSDFLKRIFNEGTGYAKKKSSIFNAGLAGQYGILVSASAPHKILGVKSKVCAQKVSRGPLLDVVRVSTRSEASNCHMEERPIP